LQLAQKYIATKHGVGGWFFSEKLDGERCYWDGGITRGMVKSEVPWANCAKDARYVDTQVATGLWSRYGNVIHAPDWWLAKLPCMPLDGELFSHFTEMKRQDIHSAIKKIYPVTTEWERICYEVFDCPPYETVFADKIIDNVNYYKVFKGILPWVEERIKNSPYALHYRPMPTSAYKSVYERMKMHDLGSSVWGLHKQYVLPYRQDAAVSMLEEQLKIVEEVGGEGLMVRNPDKPYACERAHHLLKYKSMDDAEAVVVGYTTGRETDKGSRLLGKMGAMIVQMPDGKVFELSGFTDAERELGITAGTCDSAVAWAVTHPEMRCPDWIQAKMFPRGTTVTYKYRGLNNSGLPNEARYWRKT
jgi:DNA ligase-1